MKSDLRTAIITGACGTGMGRSIALTLAKNGYCVVINYRTNQTEADTIVSYIRKQGGTAIAVQADVFQKEDCTRLITTTRNCFGRIDCCIIGPGADWHPEPLTDLKPEDALHDMYQEVAPIYYLLPPILSDMKSRGFGRIIGLASNLDIPSPAYSYNAAKSARIQTLLLAAKDVFSMGITVNVICPGPVNARPDFNEACGHCEHNDIFQNRTEILPQDIADGVAFLCSDSARYISGCVLPYLF